MNGKFIHQLVICIVILLSVPMQAQDYLYNVQQWELEDGLLHRLVHVVHEDEQGLIWVGTENGIQRFDGHEFKSFGSADPQKSTVRITKIGEDDGNWLWLWDKSRDEFSFLNTITEKMESEDEHFGTDFPIHSEVKNGRWIYNEEHLQRTKDDKLVFVLSNPCEIVTYDVAEGFVSKRINGYETAVLRYVDHDDNLWISTDKKSVTKVSLDGKVLGHFPLPEYKSVGSFCSYQEKVIFTHSDGEKRIGYEVDENLLIQKIELDWDKKFCGKYTWHLVDDEWSVSANGELQVKVPGNKYKESLYASVQDVVEDSKGRLWVGTGFGLSVIVIRKGNFAKHLTGEITPSTGSAYSIRGMEEYNGALLAQVERMPLMLTSEGDDKPFSEHVGGIPLLKTKDNVLVSGGRSLLTLFYPEGREEEVTLANVSPSRPAVAWSLAESSTGIWVGTDLGLGFYDYSDKSYELVNFTTTEFNDWKGFKEIYDIHPASVSELWLSTAAGFYVVNVLEKKIESRWYKESDSHFLPLDIVYQQYIDKLGFTWLATNNGLIKWEPNTEEYAVYNQQAGFSNNTIYGICEDEYNQLWMSSDYGIIRFDKDEHTISSYTTKHGITHNEFNRASYFQNDSGRIFFGSLDGITSFKPSDFQEANRQTSSLLLSDLMVYNGESGQLESKIGEARLSEEIDVFPHYRYINLKFAMPTYEDDNLNKYAWKLEGLDADWQIQTDNKLQLGKLPYGSHTLLVKAANSGTGWVNQQLEIRLNVLKPFYLRNWFVALMFGLTLLAIVLFFRYKTRELKANELKLRTKVAEATETIQKDKELIQRQADDLQEMDKVKSRFFTNVSHELRTPLTLILGPLEQMLSKKQNLPKHIEDQLAVSFSNSIKLKSRVDELLDLAKLDGKELKLNLAPVDVHVVLQTAVEAFRPIADNQGVALELTGAKTNEPYALVDEERFVKVVDNLLSNALKHSPVKGKIQVEIHTEGELYEVRVSDEGKGVKDEEQEAIFKRFYQTTDGEAVGGTGVGLSLSKNIAELMGGNLTLDKEYLRGASFVFQFVGKKAARPEEKNITTEAFSSDIAIPSLLGDKKLNLLLVEDNIELRGYVRRIVADDFIIHEAGDGLVALELLEKERIDLIVSDIMMPNMDGVTFVKELKKSSKDKVPIIMLSAKSGQSDIVNMLEMGVDDYVVKPFYARELLARLHNQVRNLKVRQEAAAENTAEEVVSYSGKWINELRLYVLENIANVNFGVVDLVTRLSMSERTLNRKLNKEYGMSSAAYIKEIRLQKAQEYLQNSSFSSVKEVSAAVGFKRQDYFTREFYKRYGKYPSEY